MLLYSFYAFLLIVRSSIILKLKIHVDCKMSPDNVASSITLGNFTVGRRYRAKKSDMADSSPMPIFAAHSDKKSGRKVSHFKRFIAQENRLWEAGL